MTAPRINSRKPLITPLVALHQPCDDGIRCVVLKHLLKFERHVWWLALNRAVDSVLIPTACGAYSQDGPGSVFATINP